jgi:hypothetical protein
MAIPSWLQSPQQETIIKALKAKMEEILHDKKFNDTIANLAFRWMDEKEYEDFKDYEKVMKEKVETFGVKFIKGSKRPFGFVVEFKEVAYQFYFTMKACGYKPLPIKK